MNLSSPCPAAAYVTRPGFGKYEPGAYPFVGLARMFHGIGAMKKAMRLATALFWLFANVCVSARNKNIEKRRGKM